MIVHVATGGPVRVCEHAITRYWERCLPGAPDYHHARLHLRRLLEQHGTLDTNAPTWATSDHVDTPHHDTEQWVHIGPDIAFPVMDGTAITCLCRGIISDKARQLRNDRRRALKFKRKRARLNDKGADIRNRRDAQAPEADAA